MIHNNIDYEELFKRNIGFITDIEQTKIANASIGIAGLGADGGLLAERITRFGIGKIALADPEHFEANNVNRQYGANINNLGKNKAEVIAKELALINPKLNIIVFNKGINRSNVKVFVDNCDVVVDEIEYSRPYISVLLAGEARRQNKYLFMGANVGWGASIFCFSPNGTTFEEYFQYNSKTKKVNLLRYIKTVPKYFDNNLLSKVIKGEIPAPSLSTAVGLTTSLLSTEIILFLLNKRKVVLAPKFLFYDAFNQKIERR